MKSQLLGCLIVLGSSVALAQGGSSTTRAKESTARTHAAKGIQLSVFSYKPELKMESGNFSESDKEVFQIAAGLSLGYINAPINGIGWDSNLAIAEVRSKGKDASSDNIGRLSGNISYSFNELLRIKGGLNLTNVVSIGIYNPGIGGQVGMGIQANSMLGVDISYVSSNIETKENLLNGKKLKASLEGLEIGVTATF